MTKWRILLTPLHSKEHAGLLLEREY